MNLFFSMADNRVNVVAAFFSARCQLIPRVGRNLVEIKGQTREKDSEAINKNIPLWTVSYPIYFTIVYL